MLVMFVPNTTMQKIKLDFPCDRTNMILFSLHGSECVGITPGKI